MKRLHLMLPSRERAGLDATADQWLLRGDPLDEAAPGHAAMLAELFKWPGASLPAAALTRQHACGDAEQFAWLCADPARVEADINGARMMACGNFGLQPDEAEQLAVPLRPLLGDAGAMLELTTPDRWHLRLPAGAHVPAFDAPDAVLGDDLLTHLEGDADMRRWRRLFTEVQTELHQHPVNAARSQRGLPSVNALWFWGGGSLPMWVKSSLQQVFSDDPLTAALASRADATCHALEAFDEQADRLGEETLLDLGQHALEPDAWQSLLGLLRRRCVDELLLMFADGERHRLRRGHRWRFWRRA